MGERAGQEIQNGRPGSSIWSFSLRIGTSPGLSFHSWWRHLFHLSCRWIISVCLIETYLNVILSTKEKLVVGYSLRFNSEVYSLWLVELSYPVCMCFIIRGSRKQCQETHFISVLIIISAVQATQNKCLAFPEIAIDSAADFTRPINNSFLHTPLPQCIFVITISVPPVLSSACNWSRINGWFHLFPGKKKGDNKLCY